MSLIDILPKIIKESRQEYENIIKDRSLRDYKIMEIAGIRQDYIGFEDNILAKGNNLTFMKYLIDEKDMKGKVKLIYIDPPFFTSAHYGTEFKLKSETIKTIPAIRQKAYSDTWEEGMGEYLKMLATRLMLMKDLLAEDGSIFVHLDWHAVHYVKVVMDEIFGGDNFVNEIIWHYKSGGASKRRFARKHDTLLFYGKSKKYYFMAQKEKSYNRGYKPYRFKGVEEFQDRMGWYTMVNRKDVWQLDMVGRTSSERTGYATQKPESLIERILESCTREGDICADFFSGSGTLASAANAMGRRWISCDIGKLAAANSIKRLLDSKVGFSYYEEAMAGDLEKGQVDVSIDMDSGDMSVEDKKLLKVEIKGYRLHSGAMPLVEEKYLSIINRVMKEDPLQFISFWSIDLDLKDGINRADAYFLRNSKGMDTSYQTWVGNIDTVRIMVTDIFGNITYITKNTAK